MNISLVAACTRNRVIGNDGTMPWHLPADLVHFKKVTMGKPVLMGRKTWETLFVRPLPGRRNIVLSRRAGLTLPQAEVIHSIADLAAMVGEQECLVIGGAEVYRTFIPLANTIYLTRIEAEIDGDVMFPEYEQTEWRLVAQEYRAADADNPYDLQFLILQRTQTDYLL